MYNDWINASTKDYSRFGGRDVTKDKEVRELNSDNKEDEKNIKTDVAVAIAGKSWTEKEIDCLLKVATEYYMKVDNKCSLN